MAVFKSLRFVYAQVIDDRKGTTLVQANSQEAGVREAVKGGASSKAAAPAARLINVVPVIR